MIPDAFILPNLVEVMVTVHAVAILDAMVISPRDVVPPPDGIVWAVLVNPPVMLRLALIVAVMTLLVLVVCAKTGTEIRSATMARSANFFIISSLWVNPHPTYMIDMNFTLFKKIVNSSSSTMDRKEDRK